MAMPKFSSPKLLVVASAALLALGAGVWRFALRSDEVPPSTLPESLSVDALKAQAADPRTLRETMRETMRGDDLTDEQHRELRRNIRQFFDDSINERVNGYFDASPAEQTAILDDHIAEMQERMARFEERRGEGEDRRREDRQGQPGRGFRQRTQQERKQSSESRNPDETGRRAVYFAAFQRRVGELGIRMPTGRGGMGGDRGGRGP